MTENFLNIEKAAVLFMPFGLLLFFRDDSPVVRSSCAIVVGYMAAGKDTFVILHHVEIDWKFKLS